MANEVDLVAGRFDAAVRIGTLRGSSLVARRLAPANAVLVASPSYLSGRGRPEMPSELTRHECPVYTGGLESE